MIYRDPLSAALYSRGVINGWKGFAQFVPITPDERDKIRQRLDMDAKDMACASCGSTKPQEYFNSINALSCCPHRKMVPAASLVAEIDRLKVAASTLRKRAKRAKARAA